MKGEGGFRMSEQRSDQSVIHKKVIGKRDITLFCISAILLLDTLAAGAAVGVSSIFWWIFLTIIFFIPFSLITAELSCAYPDQGGIYAWVKRAYGEKWATRITWYYWVNIAVWCPAIYILFAAVFKQMFYPDMSLNMQIVAGLVLTWLTVFINMITLETGKWVPNLGAVIKVVVFAALIYGALQYSQGNSLANDISIATIMPDLGSGAKYLGVIIYGMLGFELISACAEDVKNPRKNIPLGIVVSGTIIILLYVFATVAILAAIPASSINLVEGLVDTLAMFFGGSTMGNAFVMILAIGALYSFFSNGVTWTLGGNRVAAEAAIDGKLPKPFAYESKRGTPVGAAVILGICGTVTLILYGFLVNSNEDLFWALFAFSAVLFMLPYVVMNFAYIKLRKMDTETERPFKLRGPNWFVFGLTYLCSAVLILTLISFIYVPGEGMQWPVFIGASILIIVGELIIARK